MKNLKQNTILLILAVFFIITSCEESEISPVVQNLHSQSLSSDASSRATVYKQNFEIDLSETQLGDENLMRVDISCTGEQLKIVEGTLRIQLYEVYNNKRSATHYHANISNFKLVNLESGIEYVGSYVINNPFNFSSENSELFPAETTEIYKIVLTTPGKENKIVLKTILHLTLNADGIFTASVNSISAECQ